MEIYRVAHELAQLALTSPNLAWMEGTPENICICVLNNKAHISLLCQKIKNANQIEMFT